MKKKELSDEGFDLDSELNFDFDLDSIDGDINPAAQDKNRSPVMKVFDGVAGAFKSKAGDPAFLAAITQKALPKEYGEVFDKSGEVASNVKELYNDAAKEVKPALANLTRQVNKLVPKNFEKSKEFLGGLEEKLRGWTSSSVSPQNQEEAGVQAMLADVFKEQSQEQAENRAEDQSQEQIKENIETKRFSSQIELLNDMSMSLGSINSYTTKVNGAFQKKSLELQFRSYFTQSEQLRTTKEFYKIFQAQNEAIAKNTALPEFLKITKSERMKEMMRDKFFETVQGGLFGRGEFLKKGLERVRTKVMEKAKGFKDKVISAAQGVEAVGEMKEQSDEMARNAEESGMVNEMDPSRMAGTAAGGFLADIIGKAIGNWIHGKYDTKNSKVAKFGKEAIRMAENPAESIEKLRDSEMLKHTHDYEAGGIKGFFKNEILGGIKNTTKDLLSEFLYTGQDTTFENKEGVTLGKLNEDKKLNDSKTYATINTIMPGYMARMLRELQIIRTGDDSVSMTLFNYDKNSFDSESGILKSIGDKVNRDIHGRGFGREMDGVMKTLDPESKLDEASQKVLRQKLKDLSFSNTGYHTDKLKDEKFLEGLDPAVKEQITKMVESLKEGKDQGDQQEFERDFSKKMVSLKDSVGDPRGVIQQFINAGQEEQVRKLGLIEGPVKAPTLNTKKFNELILNPQTASAPGAAVPPVTPTGLAGNGLAGPAPVAPIQPTKSAETTVLEKILRVLNKIEKNTKPASTTATSDKYAKEGIRSYVPEKALEAVSRIGVSRWSYKAGKGDEGNHVGPMAQDVKRELGDEVAPDGKALDMVSMNGVNMAAISALKKDVDNVKGRRPSKGMEKTVTAIKDDTALIAERLLQVGIKFDIGIAGLSDSVKKTFEASIGGLQKSMQDFWSKMQSIQIPPEMMDRYKKMKGSSFEDIDDILGEILSRRFGVDMQGPGKGTKSFIKRNYRKAKIGARKGKRLIRDKYRSFKEGQVDPRLAKTKGWLRGDYETIGDRAKALKNQGKEFLTEKWDNRKEYIGKLKDEFIPDAVKNIKDRFNKASTKFLNFVDPPEDVYVVGQKEPVLLARLMLSGQYFDRDSSSPIRTHTDIKGVVVDSEGKVVVSLEDITKGLVDKDGKPFVAIKDKLKAIAMGIAGKAITNIMKFGGDALHAGSKLGESVGDLFGSLGDRFKDLTKGFGLGGNRDVLLDIRDVLNTRLPGEPTQFAPEKSAGDGKQRKGFFETAKKLKEEFKASKIGPQLPESLKKLKENKTVNDLLGKAGAGIDKLAPKGSVLGGVLNRFRKKPEADDKLQPDLPTEAQPRYKSGTNVIDTMIDKGSSLFSFGKGVAEDFGKKRLEGPSGGKLGIVKDLAGSLLGGSKDPEPSKDNKPATKEQAPPQEENKSVLSKINQLLFSRKKAEEQPQDKVPRLEGPKKFNDADGDGRREGDWRTIQEDRKKEKEKKDLNKKNLPTEAQPRYKSDKNVIDTMIEKAGSAFKLIQSGLGMVGNAFGLLRAGQLAGGLLGMGGAATAAAGATTVAAGAGATAAAGAGAVAGGGMLATAATGIGYALGTAASSAMAVGSSLAPLLFSPVGLGAVAVGMVGWAGYKAFKHITRNSIEEIDRIRMAQYGLTEMDARHYHKVLALEDFLQDGNTVYTNGVAQIREKGMSLSDIFKIFEINTEKPDEITRFTSWFQKRFKPVYVINATALNRIKPGMKLRDLPKLKDEELEDYVSYIKLKESIYNEKTSPIPDLAGLESDAKYVQMTIEEVMKELGIKEKKQTDGKKIKSVTVKDKVLDSVANGLEAIGFGSYKEQREKDKKTQADLEGLMKGFKSNKETGINWSAAAKTAIAITAVLAAPLGATTVIGAMLGGSLLKKSYKKWRDNKVTAYRMAQYGLTESNSDKFDAVTQMEQYLRTEAMKQVSGGMQLDEKKVDPEILFNLFEVDPKNETHVKNFLTWFTKRFKPVFLRHSSIAERIKPGLLLDEVGSMDSRAIKEYIKATAMPDGPYSITTSPFPDIKELTADKALVASLVEKASKENERGYVGKVLSKLNPLGMDAANFLADKAKDKSSVLDEKKDDSKLMSGVKKFLRGTLDILNQSPGKLLLKATKEVGRRLGHMVTALESVRFKTYGLGKFASPDVIALRELESVMTDKVNIAGTGNVQFSGDVSDIFNKVSFYFGIAKLDSEEGKTWAAWFQGRFLPTYLSYIGAGYRITGKKDAREIELALKDSQKYEIARSTQSVKEAWDFNKVPWDKEKMSKHSSECKENIEYLKEQANKETISQERKSIAPTKSTPYRSSSKENEDKELQNIQKQIQDRAKNKKTTPTTNAGEGEPSKAFDTAPKQDKANAPVSAAPVVGAQGPMSSGAGGDQFIKLSPGVDTSGMNTSLWKNFKAMAEEYGKLTGKSIQVNSAFRSKEKQIALAKQYPGQAAAPGKSLHEFGLAIDTNSATNNELDKLGLMNKYGFTRPVGGEPWHVEPAGIQTDVHKAKSDPSFANQAIESSPGRGGGGYGTVAGAAKPKRNQELAMSLLSKTPTKAPTTPESKSETIIAAGPVAGDKTPTEKTGGTPASAGSGVLGAKMVKSEKGSAADSSPGFFGKLFGKIKPFSADEGEKAPTSSASSPPKQEPTVGSQVAGNAQGGSIADKFKETTPGSATALDKVDVSSSSQSGKEGVKDAIDKVAKAIGADSKTLQTFAAVESSMNPDAKAKTSSASGLFQFIRGTWDSMVRKYGSKYGVGPGTSPTDIKASVAMASEYIKENLRAIGSSKPGASMVDAYMAHFLGAGGAKQFLKADPATPAAQANPSAAKANPSIFYNGGQPRSIKEVYDLMAQKLQKAASRFGIDAKIDTAGAMEGKQTPSKDTAGAGASASPTGTAPTSAAQTPASGSATPVAKPSGAVDSSAGLSSSIPTASQPTQNTGSAPAGVANTPAWKEPKPDNFMGFMQPSTRANKQADANVSPAMGLSDKIVGTMSTTLTESLEVQKQMLTALQSLVANFSPEKLAQLVGNNQNQPSGNSTQSSSSQTGSTSRPGQGNNDKFKLPTAGVSLARSVI